MDSESWFNARKAVEMGFADEILFQNHMEEMPVSEGVMFSNRMVMNAILNKLPKMEKEKSVEISALEKRLSLLKG